VSETVGSARMRVAYLVNQYPKVSHSFIRREIAALEGLGLAVDRYAVRGWDGPVADPADAAEREKTRYLLRDGVCGLIAESLRALVSAPGRFLRAAGLAIRLARRADRQLPYHLIYLAQACRLCRWLQISGASHLHAHFGTNAAEVALLAHALGGPPYSFTVHGPEEFDRPAALHLREKIARAAFVVAVSSFGRSQILRWSDSADWGRVHVVHCGLDQDFLAAEAAVPPAGPRLVCVGRICEQKGQLLLVEAMATLVAEGIPVELVIAGDGEMRADVEAAIAARGVGAQDRNTRWIGSEQVRAEITAARALVLPSFAEGLPVVLMETMALGRPVISTYVAGIPELVREGCEGWLVPAGDLDALVAAMKACLQASSQTLVRLGSAARERVVGRHDVNREAAKLARLFTRYGSPGRA
jgi:colanic acid/amylovoran biosynthesis glycosyltransferase